MYRREFLNPLRCFRDPEVDGVELPQVNFYAGSHAENMMDVEGAEGIITGERGVPGGVKDLSGAVKSLRTIQSEMNRGQSERQDLRVIVPNQQERVDVSGEVFQMPKRPVAPGLSDNTDWDESIRIREREQGAGKITFFIERFGNFAISSEMLSVARFVSVTQMLGSYAGLRTAVWMGRKLFSGGEDNLESVSDSNRKKRILNRREFLGFIGAMGSVVLLERLAVNTRILGRPQISEELALMENELVVDMPVDLLKAANPERAVLLAASVKTKNLVMVQNLIRIQRQLAGTSDYDIDAGIRFVCGAVHMGVRPLFERGPCHVAMEIREHTEELVTVYLQQIANAKNEEEANAWLYEFVTHAMLFSTPVSDTYMDLESHDDIPKSAQVILLESLIKVAGQVSDEAENTAVGEMLIILAIAAYDTASYNSWNPKFPNSDEERGFANYSNIAALNFDNKVKIVLPKMILHLDAKNILRPVPIMLIQGGAVFFMETVKDGDLGWWLRFDGVDNTNFGKVSDSGEWQSDRMPLVELVWV